MTARSQAAAWLVVAFAVQIVLASRWGVSGTEALWWVGEEAPVGRITGWLPPDALPLRSPGLVMHFVAALLLMPSASRPVRLVVLCTATPALGGIALFATAAGWASGLWGIALAASLRGGVGHLVAGVLVGLGVGLGGQVASTLCTLPLLMLAAMDADERRTPWPWLGLAAALIGVAGFGIDPPDHAADPLQLGIQLLLMSSPLLGIAWAVGHGVGETRADRIARWASTPVLLGAVAGAALGWGTPPGAVAVAFWGAALGVSRAEGRAARLPEAAAWLAPLLALVLAVHVERRVVPLERDPAVVLHIGEPLGDDAVRWAMPIGVPRHGEKAAEALVLTDNGETAAWIRFHTGMAAQPSEGCRDPVVSEAAGLSAVAWNTVPCVPPGWRAVRHQESPVFAGGRRLGAWVWSELERAPP